MDFGTTHFVTLNQIYRIPSSFFDFPFQAILCTMVNIETNENYSAAAINYMNENVLNNYILVNIKCVQNKTS